MCILYTRNKCINTHERGTFLIYGNIYAPVLHLTVTGLPSAVPPALSSSEPPTTQT